MRRSVQLWCLLLLSPLLLYVALAVAQTVSRHTEIYNFINGLQLAGHPVTVSPTGIVSTITGGPAVQLDVIGVRLIPPATETLTGGATITANACGGLKRLTAAGAVTTSLTATFTAPAPANAGCTMLVCNVGANTITLDTNAAFKSIAGADIVLTADDCTAVASDGTVWRSAGSLVAN
jgi:hypothetical protein